jgi:hypothetical protein
MTTCTNSRCLYWITCQKKHKPCPASGLGAVMRNGYAAMARQEYAMRMAAINFKGDWDA